MALRLMTTHIEKSPEAMSISPHRKRWKLVENGWAPSAPAVGVPYVSVPASRSVARCQRVPGGWRRTRYQSASGKPPVRHSPWWTQASVQTVREDGLHLM